MHKTWLNQLIGAAFAFLLSVCVVGILVTAYELEAASMVLLFLWCTGCSLISAFLLRFKRGGMVLLGLLALAAPFIWWGGLLWEQLQSLSYIITEDYYIVYGWPILGEFMTDEVNLPLMVLSAWAAISVSWCFCRRKSVFIALPSLLLPLLVCLVTIDRVPKEIYLYLLILGIVMLLVTDWTRRKNPAQSVQLTLRMVLPVAAVLALIFLINPRDAYVNYASDYKKEVMSWFRNVPGNAGPISGGLSFETGDSEKLNLNLVGPKNEISHSVMRVNAPADGTVYLRGRDYDLYSGEGWESSPNRNERFTSGGIASGKPLGIVTYGVQDVRYVPYYSTDEVNLVNGGLANDEKLKEYSYYLSITASSGVGRPDARYTELPASTRQWATSLSIINEVKGRATREKVRYIGSYVKATATYDLSTAKMPSHHSDFAKWFLEESDTGYCVHFATAATVLLRAAGVPARYVEGYMVAGKAGEDVIVSNQEEHAWAEYYDYGSHTWRILEVTPSDSQDEEGIDTPGVQTPKPSDQPSEQQPGTDVSQPPPDSSEDTITKPDVNGGEKPAIQGGTGDGPGDASVGMRSFQLPKWAKTVFWILLAAAVVPVQSYILIRRKRKQWNCGKSHRKTIVRWRQAKKMARMVKHPFPEELDLLAQKATFSQHEIRQDELQLFDDYREELLAAVRSKPWYQRILLRWILAVG